MDKDLYEGREQSLVKHLILKRYLLRFALIIGRNWRSITYVDCFSGPWKSKSESYKDTSFSIAIGQLREARNRLSKEGIKIQIRAFFIERDSSAYAQLREFAGQISDIEISTRNAELEDSVSEIRDFVGAGDTFPFIFIDPKGWSGFALDLIRPLLTLQPCEVLINFMTQHIVRFIDNTASQESFRQLFGTAEFRNRLAGTARDDRVDAAVFQYRDAVANAGGFGFPGISAILQPDQNRSHFHLVYLSRARKGLEVFKAEEKKSMHDMETSRAEVEQRKRVSRAGQLEMFGPEDAPESNYFESLRYRYLTLAKTDLDSTLRTHGRILYDDAWRRWLQFPMVWESDLKDWIRHSRICVEGLSVRERVPKLGHGHWLVTVE